MKLRPAEIITLIIVFIAVALGIRFYPFLPAQIASHWGTNGQVNGYMSKFWGAFLTPIIAALLWLLLIVVPRVDPKKKNIAKFVPAFDKFIILLFLFLVYLDILTLIWNMGARFNLTKLLIPALAIIFYAAGMLIKKAEPNWTIGIRTPWTLSNDVVWQKTHQLGGKLFITSAVVTLLGVFFTTYAIWFALVPIILSSLTSIIYSYLIFRQIEKED